VLVSLRARRQVRASDIPARTVFHVDDREIISGKAYNLGYGWGEAEEEDTIKGLTVFKTDFKGLWACCRNFNWCGGAARGADWRWASAILGFMALKGAI
jgi:hypothetical protein